MQIGYQRSNGASKMCFDSSMTLHSIKRHCKWAMFIFSFHFAALDPSSQRVIALSCWARLMVEWILFFWKLRPSRWKLSQIAVAHSSRERHYFLVFSIWFNAFVCLCELNVNVRKNVWVYLMWFVSIPTIRVKMWHSEVIRNSLTTCTDCWIMTEIWYIFWPGRKQWPLIVWFVLI